MAARNESKGPSTPSLTTATSLTDTSSELTDGSAKADEYKRVSVRSRTNVPSYNENVLSAKQRRLARKKNSGRGTWTVSRETAIDGKQRIPHDENFLGQSLQAVDADWSTGITPGDSLKLSTNTESGAKKRRSRRLDIMHRASDAIEKTTTVLGKRGCETGETGVTRMEKSQALSTVDQTPKARPKESQMPSFKGSSRKRDRISEEETSNRQSVESRDTECTATKIHPKPWVSQGLYVGQHRCGDARLTETKNKERKTLNNQPEADERAIMPMPMWIGDKIIETGRDFKLPFDVFSPLPPGQPKPDEWKKTQKSIPPQENMSTFR